MTDLEKIIADLDKAVALCDKSDKLDRERVIGMWATSNLAAIRDRLAALAGAEPVAWVSYTDRRAPICLRVTKRVFTEGLEVFSDEPVFDGEIPLSHAPAKAREEDRANYWKQRAKSAEGHLFASDLSEAAKALHRVAALRETPWDELTDVQRWGLEHAALQVIATVNAQRDTRAPKAAALATFAEGEE